MSNSTTGELVVITRADTARFWNYLLGGKDNYPVDRELGEEVIALIPGIAATARAVRA